MANYSDVRRYRYEEIADHILQAVDAGAIAENGKLPSLRAMSRRFDCAVSVVMQAYQELERSGRIRAVERSGYFTVPRERSRPPEPERQRYSLKKESARPLSIIGTIVEAGNDDSITPLGAGVPHPTLLPLRDLSRSVTTVLKSRPELLGKYSDEAGSLRLRRQLTRVMAKRGVVVQTEDLLITNGCMEALSLAIQSCSETGETIAIEDPIFLGTIQLLNQLGRRVILIPTSPVTGIDLNRLETVLATESVRAVILSAVYQNPQGFIMPLEHCRRAVDLAAAAGVPIIEDDVYGETSFAHENHRPLKSFDTNGTVIYCSSFSKSLGPGMRIGWLAGGALHTNCRNLKSAMTIGNNPILQEGLAHYLSTARYDRHIRRLQTTIARQAWDLRRLLEEFFEPLPAMTDPGGGYYFWLALPEPLDSLRLFRQALRAGISIVPGPAFTGGDRFRNYIRVTYATPINDATREGVRRLGQLIREEIQSPGTAAHREAEGSRLG